MKDTKNFTLLGMLIIVVLTIIAYGYTQFFYIPHNFPVGKSFTINENESLKSISVRLHKEGYIGSPLLFRAGISFLGKEKTIQLGVYNFEKPSTLLGVVEMFVRGKPKSPLLSVTIPEGSTSDEVVVIVAKTIPSISVSGFRSLIEEYNANGKLFPSTYFLLPSYTDIDILKIMVDTFSKRVETMIMASKIPEPLSTIDDVLILASILEGEVRTEEDMKVVAGILLSRLKVGMPLQVDVAKETYKKKGLPEKPLNNPGVKAVSAVLNPVFTEYFYYISGKDGTTHYAVTFDEHKKNIKKYLK